MFSQQRDCLDSEVCEKLCLETDLRELLLPASITHAEFIVGLKRNPHIAEKLGMPAHVRQEDGTRHQYQLSFGTVTLLLASPVLPSACLHT